ncbi:MAG: hypothetical protein KKA73_18045 [Chloroflexi bacterium]|nr:hypothetical protein [Chloroflexota bacterium]MBU1749590.1 hypothetical protein [Chloroflexota bacterium]
MKQLPLARDRQPRYQAYMLRFWETRGSCADCPAVWRFSLEDPHTGERRGFADLKGLLAFLQTRTERADSSPDKTKEA